MSTILNFKNIHKSYDANPAVKGVSFSVDAGKVLGILGRNGAGKTTIVNLLVGLLSSDEGQVELFNSMPPYDQTTRSKIGLAPQRIALYSSLSIMENLTFFATLQGLKGSELEKKVNYASEKMGLETFIHRKVKACSEGMKRRANMAVALLSNAELLLLDEPTAGVDIQSRQHILDVVLDLKNSGKTVLYTTHYIEEADQVCDEVLILHEGRALACASTQDLIAQYGGDSQISYQETEHGQPFVLSSREPAKAVHQLFDSHSSIFNLRVIPPSLQDVLTNLLNGEKLSA